MLLGGVIPKIESMLGHMSTISGRSLVMGFEEKRMPKTS